MAESDYGQWGPEPFLRRGGRPITSATISVYLPNGSTLATLASDQAGSPLANPLPIGVNPGSPGLDTLGNALFFAAPGVYVLGVVVGGTEVYRTPITVDLDTAAGGGGPHTHPESDIVNLVADLAAEAAARAAADAALIPRSLVDAAGDLIVASAADNVVRLPKGADGQVLGVNSGVVTWVELAGPPLSGDMFGANNLSDVDDPSASLTNLGLSTFGKSLVDDADAAAARTTLGIGEAIADTTQPLDEVHHSQAGSPSYTTASASPIAVDTTNARLVFTVPASGAVRVFATAMVTSAGDGYFGFLAGASLVAGSLRVLGYNTTARVSYFAYITGLTPGEVTWDLAHWSNGGVISLYCDATTHGPLDIEIRAA